MGKKLFLLIILGILILPMGSGCQRLFNGVPNPSTLQGRLKIEHSWPESRVGEIESEPWSLQQEERTSDRRWETHVPNQIVMGLESSLSTAEAHTLFAAMDARVLDSIDSLQIYLVEVDEKNWETELKQVHKNRAVRFAEPNYIVNASHTTVPNDALYTYQWHYPQIRLPQAWNVTIGASWVRIAVLDTGINDEHPDLQGVVDRNSGYNFVHDTRSAVDYNGHGTHVAGIIGARTNNAIGVAGVMWDVSLIPVKVLDDYGAGSYFQVAKGILYAAGLLGTPSLDNPAHIINLSLGGRNSSELLEEAVSAARAEGLILVGAGGNDDASLRYPARLQEVIAVGAVDYNYPQAPERAPYSNYGPELEIMASGGNIHVDTDGSGHPDGIFSTSYVHRDRDFTYSYKQGTSMATPHVSGVIGLMLAQGIRPYEVRDILARTSMQLTQEPFDPYYGHGLINAYWAVNDVQEIQLLVGDWQDGVFDVVARNGVGLREEEFIIDNIPQGEYRILAWIDVRGNKRMEAGDYLAESELITFTGGHDYEINLVLREKE